MEVAVKAPPCPAEEGPLATLVLVLLHYEGHFRVLERSLREFQHLALESAAQVAQSPVFLAIEAYEAKPSFYTWQQAGARLAAALEACLIPLVTNPELLATSLALKTFLHANLLTSHETIGQSYREAVERGIVAGVEQMGLVEVRVAVCGRASRGVAVDVAEGEKKLVLWKFASQGSGLMFSAGFSREDERGKEEIDPYSTSSNDVTPGEQEEREVAHYRTSCEFPDSLEEAAFVYGHFVAEETGAITLEWENADTSSVLSKLLQFQVKVVPLDSAECILEIADGLNGVDTADWLHEHVIASDITALEDVPGWGGTEEGSEDGFGENSESEGAAVENQMPVALMERRTYELEEQVLRLEDSLAATKKELKGALDRVQIAEEIYKANLETITQLEFATAGGPVPKVSRHSNSESEDTTAPSTATPDGSATQPEGRPSSELERVQRLCAGFQEQCLWRSVENMELEAQLAAAQVEASSWRETHVEQAARLEALEQQNQTLRSHKKLLVQEVKRLQPYSQVNLAALVQEAQEARMVQRSLQAKLDSRDLQAGEGPGPTDFVLVEASDEGP
ncbi:hypothetical protein KRP22_013994 [Phytophthora ramorum]|nr:hypothetical protein KRP22_13822 [Phytophthora ramorum]